MAYSLLIKNCGQLLTMKGSSPADLGLVEDAFVACEGNKIVAVGRMSELKRYKGQVNKKTKILDAKGNVVMPGLIDCHTHLVFAGNRANEFKMKLDGKSYLDILEAGGGILSTVKATRKASRAELLKNAKAHLKEMLKMGITTVEAKSGYGLDFDTEVKILEVLQSLKNIQPVKIVSTFLGAHTVPLEFKDRSDEYLEVLMKKVLPAVKKLATFVDIFCEKKAFSIEQSKRYLLHAKKLGFKIKIHGEQINNLGACAMAAKLGAVSVDHADRLTQNDIRDLAKSSAVVVLLPLVPMFLREEVFADGRSLIDNGCRVAVSTDFNPGSAPCKNLFLAMSLACLKMGLKIEEALRAVTTNAAAALDLSKQVGSVEKGKIADLVITKVKNYQEIPYWMGTNLVEKVILEGKAI